jgi:arylsulfatase A-like enzyme
MNIILITTDQQRYDSLGIMGNPFIHTPNLDRLGGEGVVFRRAYCPNTVCTPSRVSIMTGQYLSRHGSYNIGCMTPESETFLSAVLKKDGYRTHHIGKAHWSSTNDPTSKEFRGTPVQDCSVPFTDFYGFETAEVTMGHGTYGITGHYANWMLQKGHQPSDYAAHSLMERDPNGTADWDLPVSLHSGAWLSERAIAFIESHNESQHRKRPFFLNLGFQDPHHPHVVPTDYARRLDPDSMILPDFNEQSEINPPPHVPLFRNDGLQNSHYRGRFNMAGQGDTYWGEYCQDEEKLRTTQAYYYSMIQLVDEQVGRILDCLDRLDLTEETVVIFTSDHGDMLGDHHICQKGPLAYEGVTHIPLLMRFPSKYPSQDVEDCVSLVDLVPTLLDLAGIEDLVRRDGLSLNGLVMAGTPLPRNGVRIEYKEEPDRIRYKLWVTREWKLAMYLGESFGELYNLVEDPGELVNLFDDAAYAQIKNELLMQMINDMEKSEPTHSRTARA